MPTSYFELGDKWLKASSQIQNGKYWCNPAAYFQFYSNYTPVPCGWDWNKEERYFSIRPYPMRRTLAWKKWTFEAHPIEIRIYEQQIQLINADRISYISKKPGLQNELFKDDKSTDNISSQ